MALTAWYFTVYPITENLIATKMKFIFSISVLLFFSASVIGQRDMDAARPAGCKASLYYYLI
jgi:hypothetical protein